MNKLVTQMDSIARDWLSFIKKSHEFKMVSDTELRVNTPFTDPFGDSISLLIVLSNDIYTISDQGYTLWNLKMHGVDLTDKKSHRYKNLEAILMKNNARLETNGAIVGHATRQDVPQTINDLTQTLIQVSDLIYLSRKNTRSVFLDDVNTYFTVQNKNYSVLRGMSMQGQTKLKYNIDFIFNRTVTERKFVNVYNSLSKSLVEQLIGIWADTINYRTSHNQENVPLSIIVPDIPEEQLVFAQSLSAHKIDVVPFNDKEHVLQKLAIKA
ncbi:DUF1828 domain-containing protein [Secundilactobacillus paracollinoides]|uniref:DUF1828 domain-containing protein n=1 Tax=Secundilactobacillus paracollinoides TaxID=240427 RepID=A0A1B2IVA8_9LACO|nr:DUF1828 domain-containing protein [Secundilactobacillus paracollinoides]ANZ60200.1 hypothetical protein AYR61_01765 [Secundilactobacillus paracollinoides]ANZ65994.1 hypothetical protein AYR63_01785 [Secundilactobacillus paracollinoides]